jgi:hypothetical protein
VVWHEFAALIAMIDRPFSSKSRVSFRLEDIGNETDESMSDANPPYDGIIHSGNPSVVSINQQYEGGSTIRVSNLIDAMQVLHVLPCEPAQSEWTSRSKPILTETTQTVKSRPSSSCSSHFICRRDLPSPAPWTHSDCTTSDLQSRRIVKTSTSTHRYVLDKDERLRRRRIQSAPSVVRDYIKCTLSRPASSRPRSPPTNACLKKPIPLRQYHSELLENNPRLPKLPHVTTRQSSQQRPRTTGSCSRITLPEDARLSDCTYTENANRSFYSKNTLILSCRLPIDDQPMDLLDPIICNFSELRMLHKNQKRAMFTPPSHGQNQSSHTIISVIAQGWKEDRMHEKPFFEIRVL